MNSKFFVIVFLLSLFFAETFAQDNIPNNILLDKTCNVKYNKRNDSTLVMTVSINGHTYKDSFYLWKVFHIQSIYQNTLADIRRV